jgi:hypothetical protein
VNGLLPVAALRFREALAGRMLWLLPLHFAVAFWIVRSIPGPTMEARLQAADATALGLAAVLALVAAAVMGASPLAAERLRPRGTLLLAAPVSPPARVLGTALGTGGALLLLVLGLCASAMAAVDLGVGGATGSPKAFVRSVSIEGGEADPREPGLVWLTSRSPQASVKFGESHEGVVLIEARPRVGAGAAMPGVKKAHVHITSGFIVHEAGMGGGDLKEVLKTGSSLATAGLHSPFRIQVPRDGIRSVIVKRVDGNFDLGLRTEGIRVETGSRPRALARFFHAMPLAAGLLAVMGAALSLSTVAGAGVAAGGALTLALLSLFRTLFADAASTLAHAGAMERAVEAAHGGEVDAVALTGTPPALAPLFEALARALPEGTRFDLTAAVAANEVPDAGDAACAVLTGFALLTLFLAVAVLGARRRP